MEKKIKSIVIMLIVALFTTTACKKPEIDSIDAPSTGKVGQPVSITVTSKYESNGTVDWGDGTSADIITGMSTSFGDTHTYKTKGTYTITVTEKKEINNKNPTSKTATITITP